MNTKSFGKNGLKIHFCQALAFIEMALSLVAFLSRLGFYRNGPLPCGISVYATDILLIYRVDFYRSHQ